MRDALHVHPMFMQISLVSSHLPRLVRGLIGDSKLPLGVNVCAWRLVTDWHPTQGEFLPQYHFADRLWVRCNPGCMNK